MKKKHTPMLGKSVERIENRFKLFIFSLLRILDLINHFKRFNHTNIFRLWAIVADDEDPNAVNAVFKCIKRR